VNANLEEIHGLPPRTLRRSRPGPERLARLLVATMVIVLGSAAGSRFTEPPGAASEAHEVGAQRSLDAETGAALSTDPSLATNPVRAAAPRALDAAVLRLSMRRIVIDAGHGGIDPGARTLGGLSEKEVALDIAHRLETALREDGFAVAMTRESDETLSLRERSRRANRARGDLFVSIHLNSFPRPYENQRGVETYYLGPPSDSQGELLASAENAESGYSVADVRKVVERVYANMRANDSRAFAEAVQRQLYGSLRRVSPDLEDRGVKTAPFVVLVATQMPGILVEVSCVSNDRDAALLRQAGYRQRIAQALASGIRDYAASHERREVASVTP
jgi:N-acetylmuramoyl-L-alanine amidase